MMGFLGIVLTEMITGVCATLSAACVRSSEQAGKALPSTMFCMSELLVPDAHIGVQAGFSDCCAAYICCCSVSPCRGQHAAGMGPPGRALHALSRRPAMSLTEAVMLWLRVM